MFEAGHVFERDETAVGFGLDLARTQGARADEAHVAAQNVPELG